MLFIYRFNKWDLPKGKLNKGEKKQDCAIREVEEECGICNLQIEMRLRDFSTREFRKLDYFSFRSACSSLV